MTFSHHSLKRSICYSFIISRRVTSTLFPLCASSTSQFSVSHRNSSSLNGLMRKFSPFVFPYDLTMYQFRRTHEDYSDVRSLVTVLNYNVLAQDLIDMHPYLYIYHDPSNLQWGQRQRLLFDEFLQSNADIIALQEVQEDHIELFYKSLENYGYKGVFKKRTSQDKTDGCALYYKLSVFDLLELDELEYNQPGIPILNRPNVAIIAKLRHKLNNRELVIANTHLLYNPKRWDVRLAQIQVLLAELHRIVRTSKSPAVMLVGDLNSCPRSPIIRLIEKGSYEASGPVLPESLGILPNCTHKSKSKLYNSKFVSSLFDDEEENESCGRNESYCPGSPVKHSELGEYSAKESPDSKPRDSFLKTSESFQLSQGFKFTSTYNFYDGFYRAEATTYQDRWLTVDYMFYSNMALVSRQRLPTVDECQVYVKRIPNEISPSDHLPLLATYAM